MDEVSNDDDHQSLNICKNGNTKIIFSLQNIQQNFTSFSQLKKKILKKLDMQNYDCKQTQASLRLYTIKGFEFCDYDSIQQLQGVPELFYSFGEDFNYQVRLDTLQQIKELGQGGFGTVMLMHDQLLELDVAVKFIHFRQKNGNANAHLMQKEVEALSKLSHKHIVKMYECFPHPNREQLVVLMEYLKGGELYDYWHKFSKR